MHHRILISDGINMKHARRIPSPVIRLRGAEPIPNTPETTDLTVTHRKVYGYSPLSRHTAGSGIHIATTNFHHRALPRRQCGRFRYTVLLYLASTLSSPIEAQAAYNFEMSHPSLLSVLVYGRPGVEDPGLFLYFSDDLACVLFLPALF